MSVELLSHHVKNIQRVIEEGLSPEQMILRMETEYPQYRTHISVEREAYVEAHRQAFGAIQRGDFVRIEEIGQDTEYVPDLICQACPPSSKAARSCRKKVMVEALSVLDDGLGNRQNLPWDEVVSAYSEAAKVFARGYFRFEVK